MGCRCGVGPVLVFAVLCLVPFAALAVLVQPSAQQWTKLANFIANDVVPHLFVKFLPVIPVLFFVRSFDWLAYLSWLGLAAVSLRSAVAFYAWYFFDLPTPLANALLISVPAARGATTGVQALLADVLSVFHAPDKGAQVWVDDYAMTFAIVIPFLIVESRRRSLALPGWLALSLAVVLGTDVALPLFFIALLAAERSPSHGYTPAQCCFAVRLHALYAFLAVLAVCLWLPNLQHWVDQVGTVEGQYEAGQVNPWAARSTNGIMSLAFSLGLYGIRDTAFGSGFWASTLSWIVRVLFMSAICSNVAAALGAFLFFRELQDFTTAARSTKGVKDKLL